MRKKGAGCDKLWYHIYMITNLIREKRRTLKITINRNGDIEVKAPKNLPLSEITSFIQSKEKWIIKHQTEIKGRLSANNDIVNIEKILILGNRYNINYVEGLREIKQENNCVFIPLKYESKKGQYIAKWLKNKAIEIIENRVLYFSANYKISFNSIALINAKTRWGTCSSSGAIAFNWRLIMLPPRLIDYVIIHELMHILEANHSQKFWKLVETVMPDYKKRKEDLKKCSFILNLFR